MVGHKDEQLLTALAAAVEFRIKGFNSEDLANTAWAFATLGSKDERLFTLLATVAEGRTSDCNSQDLANAS